MVGICAGACRCGTTPNPYEVPNPLERTAQLAGFFRLISVSSRVGRRSPEALGAYNIWLVEDELSRGNGIMVQVSVEDIQRDLAAYLQRVEAGETVVIVRAGQPVAEMKPVALGTKQL
jgi:prevent-host-death family protein